MDPGRPPSLSSHQPSLQDHIDGFQNFDLPLQPLNLGEFVKVNQMSGNYGYGLGVRVGGALRLYRHLFTFLGNL